MLRSKTMKVFTVLLLMLVCASNVVLADVMNYSTTVRADQEGFEKLLSLFQKILYFLMAAGGVFVVGSLILSGLRMASPNAKTRAEAMEGLKFALIGAGVFFGAYMLASWVRGLVESL